MNHGACCNRRGGKEDDMSETTDTQRLDWLERNLMHIAHERSVSGIRMDGVRVTGQLYNEALGSGGGTSFFQVKHRNIREAVDAAMAWKKENP